MIKFTSLNLLLLVFACFQALSQEALIPERIINSWGYKTIESDNKAQEIKRAKKAEHKSETYHPQFTISKECFPDSHAAKQRNAEIISAIKAQPDNGFKTYRDAIINHNCIYQITTYSRLYYLDFQPYIVEKLRAYLSVQEIYHSSSQ